MARQPPLPSPMHIEHREHPRSLSSSSNTSRIADASSSKKALASVFVPRLFFRPPRRASSGGRTFFAGRDAGGCDVPEFRRASQEPKGARRGEGADVVSREPKDARRGEGADVVEAGSGTRERRFARADAVPARWRGIILPCDMSSAGYSTQPRSACAANAASCEGVRALRKSDKIFWSIIFR